MARKRTHEAIEQIDDVDGPIANTSIHGAITSLSPVKKGRNSIFFDGTLAEKSLMRHLRYELWGLMHNSRGSLITIIKKTFLLN